MKLLFIRHGDPDYVNDSLTEVGKIEAELLSDRIASINPDEIYVSPRGRAIATAEPTLKKLNREAVTLPWIREFEARIIRPDGPKDKRMIDWDWLPREWTSYEDFYDYDRWWSHPVMMEAGSGDEYKWVISEFEKFLNEHGYEKEKGYFKVNRANNDTIAFFCHYGLSIVLMSYLMHVSPMILWHSFAAAPSSVTTIATEEREKGYASFRISAYGDISHLYAAGREPSFSARFCECYDNVNERHGWSVDPDRCMG